MVDFAIPADYRVKNLLKKRKERQELRPCQRTKKHDGDGDTNSNWNARKIGQNTEKRPGDLRRLAVI